MIISVELEKKLNELNNFDYKDDNSKMCRVEIYVDYRRGIFL
jgi:hypothetical protein